MTFRMLAVAVLAATSTSGCILTEAFPGTESVTGCLPDRATTARPAILTINQTGVHRWHYDGKTSTYVPTNSIGLSASNSYPHMIRAVPGGFYAVWDDKIVQYRDDFTKVRETPGTYGSIDIKGDVVYAAGQGFLRTMTLELSTLDTVDFQAGTHKTSHDVLVCGDRAFLLDNVVQPIYIYVVDVSDARHLRVIAEDDWEGLSHLHGQWIDKDQRKWHIVENSGGMGYGSQAIRTYGVDGKEQTVFSRHYEIEGYGEDTATESGFRILGVWPSDPPWMAVGRDGSVELGRVDLADEPSFRSILDLKAASTTSFYGAPTSAANQTLVTVIEDELRIVDLAQRRITHSQSLGAFVYDIEIEWT